MCGRKRLGLDVISTGGPAQPGRNGEISPGTKGASGRGPDSSTARRSAQDDQGDEGNDHSHAAAAGFTLIELLVVISIVVLLMALLFPALSRARKQASAVVCQSKLHQAGLIFSVYVTENEGLFLQYAEGGTSVWFTATDPPFRDYPDLSLCPSATKPLPEEYAWWGGTFHAYSWSWAGSRDVYGSYGTNYHLYDRSNRGDVVAAHQWRNCNIRGAANIPVLFDCTSISGVVHHTCPPGEFEGYIKGCQFSEICINRHNGGINVLFLDWSVRKVGLKELWTLKWNGRFNMAGPWTKAGGVQPSDWPEWMRGFKEY